MNRTLNTVEIGNIVQVEELTLSGSMRRRLQDIGIIQGTRVECLQKSPSGDPTAYLVRGTVIALRAEDAAGIAVRAVS
ncbi:ferrous iron transport protein A [Christensenellaceae bacterium NSJ-44]|uniref:Ferrous iron transport protein A n=2 Tax=Luoshenia tenuis TaxID=2763654 RepID=A0A926D119_9FIRM|nr:ferrous iron transport protein A [Luoshenia tenuis]